MADKRSMCKGALEKLQGKRSATPALRCCGNSRPCRVWARPNGARRCEACRGGKAARET